MAAAMLAAVALNANVAAAAAATWLTNPFTMAPIWALAAFLGSFVVPQAAPRQHNCYFSSSDAAFADRAEAAALAWSAFNIWPMLKRAIAEQRLSLSPREQESLNLAFEGLTARETALRMDCSERTVNYHLANAMAKLQTDNKLAAVQRACWIGLI